MKQQYKLRLMLGAIALTSVGMFAGLPAAYAANNYTAAGTSITNDATLDYSVGSVSQTQIKTAGTGNGAEFKVDRKIDVLVQAQDTAPVSVTPNQSATATVTATTATKFLITNESNATLKFGLATGNVNGGGALSIIGGSYTDSGSYTPTDVTYTIYKASSTSETAWDPVNDTTVVTSTDQLAPDASELVWVVATVPASALNNDIIVTDLTATAQESDGSALKNSAGNAINNSGTYTDDSATNKNANQASLDTVMTLLADGAGAVDSAKHGDYSAYDVFKVVSASLSVKKYVTVHWDPVNKTTSPKAIPGAYLEYCVVVANSSTTAAASSLTLADVMPTGISYVASNADDGTDSAVTAIAGSVVTTAASSAATSVAGCTGGTAISGAAGSLTTSPPGATITSLPANQWAWITFFVKLQ